MPPDLAVEVFSPSTRAIDAVRKRADYAKVGVAEGVLTSPLLPGLEIPLSGLLS